MEITINISGIAKDIMSGKFLKQLEECCKKGIMQTLASASDIVDTAYASESTKGYSISVDEIDKGGRLTASGDRIGFLEFGAGTATSPDEFADEVPFNVYPGSWSEENDQQFVTMGYWKYRGHLYTMKPATHGMQKAKDYIRENAIRNIEGKLNECL